MEVWDLQEPHHQTVFRVGSISEMASRGLVAEREWERGRIFKLGEFVDWEGEGELVWVWSEGEGVRGVRGCLDEEVCEPGEWRGAEVP
eukprot:2027844-Rhodomonas_salina.1